MIDDKTLMSKFQAGDNESFETLILRHRKHAVSFAARYIHDTYLAEDIVQESFADIYVYKERYNGKYAFKTYLYTIIRYKAIDELRKHKSYAYDTIEVTDYQSPEVCLLKQEQNNMVLEKLSYLKEEYRIVLYLSQFEDLKQKDIAKIMGKNIGQIKILVYRAKKKLRKLIEEEVI